MIYFNKPPVVGTEIDYIKKILSFSEKLSGNGNYSRKCETWLEQYHHLTKALLTPSCTAALEMAALLIGVKEGDEIIMPSFTFVSTANAFVLRGAKIVFVDIRKDTMNIDETKIEAAITSKTKAIVPVHYAGIACEMNKIMEIAKKYNLYVIEDAAQALMSSYHGQSLGYIGHFGCFSFHETKNYTSAGEGGALIINHESFMERAEIIREKGTNRSKFLQGQVDKYTWHDVGSSFLMSEFQAGYLCAQFESAELINNRRLAIWNKYHQVFKHESDRIQTPKLPDKCTHNAHMYYIKLKSMQLRDAFIKKMQSYKVQTPFHYIPLHSSPAGKKYCRFAGEDHYTTEESGKLVRLPLWYNMRDEQVNYVIESTLNSLNELYEAV